MSALLRSPLIRDAFVARRRISLAMIARERRAVHLIYDLYCCVVA
jgi:hypothetical protein